MRHIINDTSQVPSVRHDLADALDGLFDSPTLFGVLVAVEEALVNGIVHGNCRDASKSVQLECHITDSGVDITITDEGKGFNQEAVPDPLDPDNLEKPGGRGLLFIRHYMDAVEYAYPGNRVRMTKKFSLVTA